MSLPPYPTPEDAEIAFYEAIENADLDRLMAVWSDDDDIVCLHPNGHRLVGHAQIRDSWRAILGSGRRLQIIVARTVRWQGAMLSIHNVVETLYVDNQPSKTPAAATNVYVRGPTGWRLLVHHASMLAAGSEPDAGRGDDTATPKVLH